MDFDMDGGHRGMADKEKKEVARVCVCVGGGLAP